MLLGLAHAVSCGTGRDRAGPPDPHADALARLRAFETARRDQTDFRTLPTSDEILGPDPVAIRRLPGSPLLVGVLRGRSAVVLLCRGGADPCRSHPGDSARSLPRRPL